METYFRSMYYIRYANDFLNLVTASHTECVEIIDNITTLFKENCELTLNKDKTLITNMRKQFKILMAKNQGLQ